MVTLRHRCSLVTRWPLAEVNHRGRWLQCLRAAPLTRWDSVLDRVGRQHGDATFATGFLDVALHPGIARFAPAGAIRFLHNPVVRAVFWAIANDGGSMVKICSTCSREDTLRKSGGDNQYVSECFIEGVQCSGLETAILTSWEDFGHAEKGCPTLLIPISGW